MSDFKKAKLSHKAVDALMLKCKNTEGHCCCITYTLSTGQQIEVSLLEANLCKAEYLYLLGQVSAVHKGIREFPINQMAVLRKKDGRDVLWTRNAVLLKSFVQLGYEIGLLLATKKAEGIVVSPNMAYNVVPIIHDETE